jgi:glycosyltransferase involved in cell wall biosynthesis
MNKTTIVIPSKNEKFLKNTIEDILKNATGDIEIFPVLDGYTIPEEEVVKDERVKYVELEATTYSKKRQAINHVIYDLSTGDYVMSVDGHCMFAKGFDEQLIKDHKPNWVQIPRRHRLDAENWCLQDQCDARPPIDYEYIMFKPIIRDRALHGFKWDDRSNKNLNVPIDRTIEFQGSCWFMSKKWFQDRGFMSIEYQGWGQEAEEIGLETYKNGGQVMTNKNTWYAHLHKGTKHGRMYFLSKSENKRSYDYAFNKWIIEEKEFFINHVKSFPRMPGWPDNWEEEIRNLK